MIVFFDGVCNLCQGSVRYLIKQDKKGVLKFASLQGKYAKDFVYTQNIDVNNKSSEIPIGVSCRTCDRLDCSQRAFPPLHKKFDVDINTRGVSIYVTDN